jgi:hypothetical protein
MVGVRARASGAIGAGCPNERRPTNQSFNNYWTFQADKRQSV